MKRFITLLLSIVMIVAVFASCVGDKPSVTTPAPTDGKDPATDAPSGTPAESNSGDGTDKPITPEDEELNIDVDNLDYGEKDFYIYHWNTSNPEFDVDQEATAGDPINDALYKRNLYTEQNLGITLNFHAEDGHDHKQDNFVEKLELRLSDPETPVDLIASYSRAAPHILISGHAVDLVPYDQYLDLSKAWWPSLVREEHEIKGRVFYTSGDASTGLLTQIEAIFMNKSLLKSFGYDYDEFMTDVINVKKGSGWTIDKLISMTKDLWQDIDGVDGKSYGDFFGLIGAQVNVSDNLWTGMGYRLFEISSKEDEIYVISTDLSGENARNYVQMITDWSNTNDASITKSSNYWTPATVNEHFGGANALFAAERLISFDAASMEVDYTVLPSPKKNADQDRYYTCVGNPYSLFSICDQAKDKDLVAQVLQVMGYHGYNLTTPAIFDATFKGKYAKDDYSLDVFDIIREGITFDIGRTFDRITETMLPNLLSYAIVDNIPWSSQLSPAKRKLLDKQIQKKANESILKILDSIE